MILNPRSTLRARAGPAGLHLFERQTGLSCLLDEVRVPPDRWAAAPRQLSVTLTNVCEHCYTSKSKAMLAADQVCRWVDELEANGGLGVRFGGGSPRSTPGSPTSAGTPRRTPGWLSPSPPTPTGPTTA